MYKDIKLNKSALHLRADLLKQNIESLGYSALSNFDKDSISRLATFRVLSQIGHDFRKNPLNAFYYGDTEVFVDNLDLCGLLDITLGFYIPEGVEVKLVYENGYLKSVVTGFPFKFKDCTDYFKSIVPEKLFIDDSIEISGFLTVDPVYVGSLFNKYRVQSPYGAVCSYLKNKSTEEGLIFYAMSCSKDFDTVEDSLDFLSSLGFAVVEYKILDTVDKNNFYADLEFLSENYQSEDLAYFSDSFRVLNLQGLDLRLIPKFLSRANLASLSNLELNLGAIEGSIDFSILNDLTDYYSSYSIEDINKKNKKVKACIDSYGALINGLGKNFCYCLLDNKFLNISDNSIILYE